MGDPISYAARSRQLGDLLWCTRPFTLHVWIYYSWCYFLCISLYFIADVPNIYVFVGFSFLSSHTLQLLKTNGHLSWAWFCWRYLTDKREFFFTVAPLPTASSGLNQSKVSIQHFSFLSLLSWLSIKCQYTIYETGTNWFASLVAVLLPSTWKVWVRIPVASGRASSIILVPT